MNNYFETYNKKDCNGCGVCALKCPKNAIKMEVDEEGFLYPVIDKEKCINCGLCKRICPNNPKDKNNNSKTYIAYNLDKEEKKKSSSGGMFAPIAKWVINHNGVVFGVTFNENLEAYHTYVDNIEDIVKFQGSKYVRSDLKDSYKKAEEFLKEGKYVLFTGTPCQCQGIRTYMQNKYDKLITCEIVCHANPSPKVLKMYIKNLGLKYDKKVKNIYFRSKENGWRNQVPITEFIDSTKIEENSYFKAFVREMINRPSCYSCRFCTPVRYSDFSIADFWGIEKVDPTIKNDDSGISLFNVNTEKGMNILNDIKDELFLKEVNTELAFSYNHHCNVPIHKNRDKFFKELENGKINEKNIIKYMNKYSENSLYKKVLGKGKRIIKKIINKG